MKYRFMAENRDAHSVEMMARMLKVTRSGFYAWLNRCPSQRAKADAQIIEHIRDIQRQVRHSYGSPRLTQELSSRGMHVGHNHVARIIGNTDLAARRKKPFRITSESRKDQWIAANILDREFEVAAPNTVWVSDITYILTKEGWLFLAVIIDLCSRKVVGWSASQRITAQLLLDALLMAVSSRRPPAGLIFHSDRGSQYASHEVRRALARCQAVQSMSRKGNCWDNACAESFFKSLKVEWIGDKIFATRREARTAIFEYIEVFYNRRRLHSTLDYVSPEQYEQRWKGQTAA